MLTTNLDVKNCSLEGATMSASRHYTEGNQIHVMETSCYVTFFQLGHGAITEKGKLDGWTGPTLHLHDQELKKKSDDCTLRDICIESDTPKSVQGSLSDQKYLCSISNRFWLLRDDPRRGDISSP